MRGTANANQRNRQIMRSKPCRVYGWRNNHNLGRSNPHSPSNTPKQPITKLDFDTPITYNQHMKNNQTPKPDNYQKYREEGMTQAQAFRKNLQDIINWGIEQGHLESTYGTK
jgi:hypothetical protein